MTMNLATWVPLGTRIKAASLEFVRAEAWLVWVEESTETSWGMALWF